MDDAWNKLNQRQQAYMQFIFERDQAQERAEKRRSALDRSSQSAELWRWIEYADTMHGHTPLKQAIKDAGLVDPGTGSTFKALETRGYILVKYERVAPHPLSDLIVWVRLTTKGRKLVRAALHLTAPQKMMVGTLHEWHWKALALAYEAGEKGVPATGPGYGRIGWQTWLRLRDYKIQGIEYPLIRWQHNGVMITDLGIGYYERSFARYSDFYPDVSAPTPRELHNPTEPFIEIVQDYQDCQACTGYYLIAITRTYQQDPKKGIWSVQESRQRIPGQVIRKYRETEQCLCQDEEIQEGIVPFLTLLDRLREQNWQIGFTHWFRSLDNAVGGVVSGRDQRWYPPTLVKQKLQPLLPNIDWKDDWHVVKGDVCHIWNPRVGNGKVYPREPNEGLSLRPLALTCHRDAPRS